MAAVAAVVTDGSRQRDGVIAASCVGPGGKDSICGVVVTRARFRVCQHTGNVSHQSGCVRGGKWWVKSLKRFFLFPEPYPQDKVTISR